MRSIKQSFLPKYVRNQIIFSFVAFVRHYPTLQCEACDEFAKELNPFYNQRLFDDAPCAFLKKCPSDQARLFWHYVIYGSADIASNECLQGHIEHFAARKGSDQIDYLMEHCQVPPWMIDYCMINECGANTLCKNDYQKKTYSCPCKEGHEKVRTLHHWTPKTNACKPKTPSPVNSWKCYTKYNKEFWNENGIEAIASCSLGKCFKDGPHLPGIPNWQSIKSASRKLDACKNYCAENVANCVGFFAGDEWCKFVDSSALRDPKLWSCGKSRDCQDIPQGSQGCVLN